MYDEEYVRTFYNAYGEHEWSRLEATPYGRLQAIIHEEFLLRYLKPGDKVLDAGAGPGRFSIIVARAGANVTILDISDKQIEIARQKISAAGLSSRITTFIRGDISDLSEFHNEHFDLVICFGGALSYACEKRQAAAMELTRVTRPGGVILVSVMSKLGGVVAEAQLPDMPNLQNPDGDGKELPGIWPVFHTGNLTGMQSKHAGMMHAAMHCYTSDELASLFKGNTVLETAASNAVIKESATVNERLAADPIAWKTVIEMERQLNHQPGLVDSGGHIIMAIRKND